MFFLVMFNINYEMLEIIVLIRRNIKIVILSESLINIGVLISINIVGMKFKISFIIIIKIFVILLIWEVFEKFGRVFFDIKNLYIRIVFVILKFIFYFWIMLENIFKIFIVKKLLLFILFFFYNVYNFFCNILMICKVS